MSIDLTRLDCVRSTSLAKAKEAVIAALSAKHFVRSDEPEPERSVYLFEEDGWLVVMDSDPFANEPWAATLSKALESTGVSITAYPDFGSLEIARYEAGENAGGVSIDEGTERDADGWLEVKLPFLADIAPAEVRATLRTGLTLGELTGDMAMAVAREVGLPRPRNKYQGPPQDSIALRFASAPGATGLGFSPLGATGLLAGGHDLSQLFSLALRGSPDGEAPTAEELAEIEELANALEISTPQPVSAASVSSDADASPPPADASPPPTPDGVQLGDIRGFVGRSTIVGRMQWDGPFDAIASDALAVTMAVADALLAAADAEGKGAPATSVHLRRAKDGSPIRVGGPLAPSRTKAGRAIWENIRENLGGGANLDLYADFARIPLGHSLRLEVRPPRSELEISMGYDPSPVQLHWSVTRPGSATALHSLSSEIDAAFDQATRSKHLVEALILAQREHGEIDYPRIADLWAGIRKRSWFVDHVASPAWRLFVPRAAVGKLGKKKPHGVRVSRSPKGWATLASDAPDPCAMSAAAMDDLARFLLPAFGTTKELEVLDAADVNGAKSVRPKKAASKPKKPAATKPKKPARTKKATAKRR